MDMSSGEWLSDLAMEDEASIIQQCQIMMMNWDGCFDPTDLIMIDTKPTSSGLISQQTTSSHELLQPVSCSPVNQQAVKVESNRDSIGWNSCANSSSRAVSGQLISFGSSEYCDISSTIGHDIKANNIGDHGGDDHVDEGGTNKAIKYSHQKGSRNKRFGSISLCSQEHVLAERKRREKMTQRFHALSALIPGLKKMDKASILGDAAKYLKQLEEQVKVLEEQTAKRTVESVVLVKKIQDPNLDDGNSSSDESSNSSLNLQLEIEARASNENVLIRIHSQNEQGLVRKVLKEVEKLHLTTLNCSTMPFGGYATDITIIAQMDDEFDLTMKDLVVQLRLALQQSSSLQK